MDSQQQAPAGGFSKRHVSGMLKHLEDDAQRSRALEVAAAFKRKFAEEKKWEAVVGKIQRLANEDPLRITSRRRPAPITPAGRPALTTSASAPPATLKDVKSSIASHPRSSTASSNLSPGTRARAPSTPRERWDIVYRGPTTPLTPTPSGNTFAAGGFWSEQLTPKTPEARTPVTAIPLSPVSPIILKDAEARAAYDHVKSEMEAMGRTVCASRLSVLSKIHDSDEIPKSLITPKDHLKGAEITLYYRQVDSKSAIDPTLPKKLEGLANDEAQIMKQYSVQDLKKLEDIDEWLQVDEQTLNFTTILDAQREALRMHRHRRKSKVLKLTDRAIQEAWAVRILEDAERAVEADDGSSTHSDEDKGYEYNNFLRSIKREVSSSSEATSLADLGSIRSTTSIADSLRQSRDPSQRSSTSPKKFNTLPSRSRESSFSNSPSPKKPSSSQANSRDLSIILDIKEEDEALPSAELSPEDRAFRRMGASQLALNDWAQQLKEMETRAQATAKKAASKAGSQLFEHPALRSSQHKRNSSADSSDSWKCGTASKHEREASTKSFGLQQPSSIDAPSAKMMHGHSRSRHKNTITPISPISPAFHSPYPPTRPSSPTQSHHTSFDLPVPPAAPSGYRYAVPTHNTTLSLHDSVRRSQHVRSKSSIARASGSVQNEDEWSQELKRMESRERMRQQEEFENAAIMDGVGRAL